jgi:hypothetical protein
MDKEEVKEKKGKEKATFAKLYRPCSEIGMASKQMQWHAMNPHVFTTHAMARYESKCIHHTWYRTL